MTREKARELFSDYLDHGLDLSQREEMQSFLAKDPDCAAELFALEHMLSLLHRLPPREPALDMWREFAPRVEEFPSGTPSELVGSPEGTKGRIAGADQ